jgi:NADP-dependent 3-hydroxy acid dehydrogenase YdfG
MRLTLNQGMRMDLNPFGIRVGAIHPGMVQTEFSEVRFKGDTDRAEKYIKGSCPTTRRYRRHHSLGVSRPYHINIADLVVMSTAQASSTIIKS